MTRNIGRVTDNNDPLKIGRLKIECPNLVAGDTLEWILPSFHYVDSANEAGCFWVPNIDSMVEVFFETDVPETADIQSRLRWKCGVYPLDKVPSEFIEEGHYPQRRGWKTAAGHVFYFDDTDDNLDFVYQHPSGTSIKVDNDGNIHLSAGSGKSVLVGQDADQKLVRGDNLESYFEGASGLRVAFNTHTHLESGGGTTGTPSTNFVSFPANALSDDHKVK